MQPARSSARSTLLYVTDLAYRAPARRYCDEDIYLAERLRESFGVALCHPHEAARLMGAFDAVVIRNCGPGVQYQPEYAALRERALATSARVYNSLTGKADMAGKHYLVELFARGFPVIPTVDRLEDLDRLPRAERYVVKPKTGCDSMGLEILGRDELAGRTFDGMLIQPLVDFAYEVSFYFVDDAPQYALRTPDTGERWNLERYEPTAADVAFARRFVAWNAIAHGIQRVDACRTRTGELLLVEVEDHNPYLSLDLLDDVTREAFVANVKASLQRLLAEQGELMRSDPGHFARRGEARGATGD